jgi:hypothetical protein
MNFQESPSSWSRALLYGRMYGSTDVTRMLVDFRICFSDAPSKFQTVEGRILLQVDETDVEYDPAVGC